MTRHLLSSLLFPAAALAAALALDVAPARARMAPDPLPAFETLVGEPHVVLRDVSDVVGKLRVVGDPSSPLAEMFVWDFALVRHPDGTVMTLRYEFQVASGELLRFESRLEDHPPGSVELFVLGDAHGWDVALVTDEHGRIRHVPRALVPAGSFGPGGRVYDPGAVLGGGACYLAPVYRCPSYSWSCPGLLGGPCLFLPSLETCACVVGRSGQMALCPLEIEGHVCRPRSCATGCGEPCTCADAGDGAW